jgi:hypothetical protein
VIVGVRSSLQLRFQVLTERFSDNCRWGYWHGSAPTSALGHPEHLTKIIGLRIV